MPSLFDPIRLGAISAPNRILMAPLTRARGTREHVPTPVMAEYYVQRAAAGLIISEATGISREGLGWPYAPGVWTDEQVEGWRPVVDAVHAAGGRIVCQLWHMGRLVHPSFLGGAAPVSSSATTAPGQAHTYNGKQPYGQARALEADEIPRLLEDYRRAARNALAAGFDGVQIHAANGYLIDEFIRDGANHRTDGYGGAPQNRVRLLSEVAQAVVGEIGGEHVGVRLSPNGNAQGVDDSDPHGVFPLAGEALKAAGVAWLELREGAPDSSFIPGTAPPVAPAIKTAFGGPMVLNSDFDGESAQRALDEGRADAIAFGRPFIANPDLPARLRRDAELAKSDMKTWYSQGREGYVDYPALQPQPA
ncbi:MAG: alkene reductase [Caulobacteraceae bacterium]|nr:alkene reductase [Caulobacter sp.]